MAAPHKRRTQAKPEPARDIPRTPLVLAWDWRRSNPHLFVSDTGLRWHLRQHRNEYIAAGALLQIGGRLFVDPGKFESTLRAVGTRVAAGRPMDRAEAL